jgi:uncharacterized protein (UPF0332 family)
MIYKETEDSLLKQGLIKPNPVDWKVIGNLIRRARIDLETAERNLDDDPECAYTFAYNAMLRSGLALMSSRGFRPEIKDKHLTIVKYTGAIVGKKYEDVMNDYDFMRRKRNNFIYEPDIPCSLTEAKNALVTARKFILLIDGLIKRHKPQGELGL